MTVTHELYTKKTRARRPCVLLIANYWPRQEPGRYFASMPFDEPGPQTHLNTVPPTSVLVSGLVASLWGIMSIVFEAAAFRSLAAEVVMVILPALVVCTLATYFVAALDSHPHALAAGKVEPTAL